MNRLSGGQGFSYIVLSIQMLEFYTGDVSVRRIRNGNRHRDSAKIDSR